MDITPTVTQGKQLIQGYGNGGFKISGENLQGSALVLPDSTAALSINMIDQVTPEMLAPLTQAQTEIVLFGTGTRMQAVPQMLRDYLRSHHIAVEAMDTGAACRTFNILLAEGRNVSALLIAV